MSLIDYFIWSNGDTNKGRAIFRNKQFDMVKELENKKDIDQIYIKDDCALFIGGGVLFKQGYFSWEKPQDASFNIKPIFFTEGKDQVMSCSLGNSHVIILADSGNMYSWGDNYYGQLGQNNFMIPVMYEPKIIKMSEKIKNIWACKDTNFALDRHNKLWAWGRAVMLGGRYKGNRFKPERFMSNYKIEHFKIEDGRAIVSALKQKKEEEDKTETEVLTNRIEKKTSDNAMQKVTPQPEVNA